MSSTRYADPGTDLRQERWASSPEYEKGLKAQLVAMRCQEGGNTKVRALIWSIQHYSWQDGGLRQFAWDFIDHCVNIKNPSTGMKYGPDSAEQLEEALTEFCLNPKTDLHFLRQPWFYALPDFLSDYVASRCVERMRDTVITEIGRRVHETLDYGLTGQCMVIIDGLPGRGKTYSVKAWCESNPGRARYVQVPSGTDDKTFFRTIARAIGMPSHVQYKAQQFAERVEDALQTSKLMLVMDEAHYLWGNVTPRGSMPKRIQWLMTALVNYGVPVALVTTPQFFKFQTAVEKNTCWTSEQFTRRIGHYEKLPDDLNTEDLEAVARFMLPNGDAGSIRALAAYAEASDKYLGGVESAVRRAFHLANKAGRDKPSAKDVREAIKDGVLPSDTNLRAAMADATPSRRQRGGAATAPPRPALGNRISLRPVRDDLTTLGVAAGGG